MVPVAALEKLEPMSLAIPLESTARCTRTTCRADPASNRGPAFICYTANNTPGVYSREASIRGNTVLSFPRDAAYLFTHTSNTRCGILHTSNTYGAHI